MEKQTSIFFLIPVKIRLKLENTALKNGVTMSWIVRAIIHNHRQTNQKMPKFHRPHKFSEKHVRFCLKLYGNKSEILTYCRCNGGEFSAFVRYLLDEWYYGRIIPDLDGVMSVKNLKRFVVKFVSVASITLVKSQFYKNYEFWDKNPVNNYRLMKFGLSFRKHPLEE